MLRGSTGVLALSAALVLDTAITSGQPALTPIRALALAPDQYANRTVTVAGRFRGRPQEQRELPAIRPLNRSRWDFLLNVEDASVWISGIRPAGWDFDLDPLSAADSRSGRWLEVTGTVRVAGATPRCAPGPQCGQVWIEASDLRPTVPDAVAGRQMPLRPAIVPPTIVFHDPIDGETGVSPAITVRLQFSRPLIAETLSEQVRVSHASPRSLAAAPVPTFTAVYRHESRSLAITFASRLDPLQMVKVELLGGIAATNGLSLEPSSFSFTTGG